MQHAGDILAQAHLQLLPNQTVLVKCGIGAAGKGTS
jgi:hypothetical protein